MVQPLVAGERFAQELDDGSGVGFRQIAEEGLGNLTPKLGDADDGLASLGCDLHVVGATIGTAFLAEEEATLFEALDGAADIGAVDDQPGGEDILADGSAFMMEEHQ